MPDDPNDAARADELGLPFARSWWIAPGRIIGGRYPGTRDPAESEAMLARLLDVGVRVVVNLQEPHEVGRDGATFPDYSPRLAELAAARGASVRFVRCSIRDRDVPADAACVQRALDAIATLRDGERAYVHCWGGHGRTGTVAGCWLVGVDGASADEAFARMASAREHDGHLRRDVAPQTEPQRQFVRDWAARGRR